MSPARRLAPLAFAVLVASCMTSSGSSPSPLRLRLSCDVEATATTLRLRDVPLGSVVQPSGANYAVGHDGHGIFAISMVAPGGGCALSCDDDDTIFDPCHTARWSADGTSLATAPDATGDLPHFAVHIDGICDQSTVRVDAAPNAVEVDPTDRVWVP